MPSPSPSLSLFSLWDQCSEYLVDELPPQQFNTWIKPLVVLHGERNAQDVPGETLVLEAPNRFIKDWVAEKFQLRLEEFARMFSGGAISRVKLEVSQQEAPGFLRQPYVSSGAQGAVKKALYDADNIIERSQSTDFYDPPPNGDLNQRYHSVRQYAPDSKVALAEKQKTEKAEKLRDFSEELNLGTPKLSFESSDAAFLNSAARTSANADRGFSDDWSATEFKNETFSDDLLPAEPFPNDVKAPAAAKYPNTVSPEIASKLAPAAISLERSTAP